MFEILWLCALAILAYYGYSKSPTIRMWVGKLVETAKATLASKAPAEKDASSDEEAEDKETPAAE